MFYIHKLMSFICTSIYKCCWAIARYRWESKQTWVSEEVIRRHAK